MVLTELRFTPNGDLRGPFGPIDMVLRRRTDREYQKTQAETEFWKFEYRTHHVLAVCPKTRAELPWAWGLTKECPASGLVYVQAFLGSTPVVFESTHGQTVLCRVGYRTDFKHRARGYRHAKWPDQRVILPRPQGHTQC